MRKNRFTINMQLILLALTIFLSMAVLGIYIIFILNKTAEKRQKIDEVEKISYNIQQLNQLEKAFLLKETSNPDFFETGSSPIYDEYQKVLKNAREKLNSLNENHWLLSENVKNNIGQLQETLEQLNIQFTLLYQMILQKGFKSHGKIGDMRAKIHAMEEELNQLDIPGLQQYMLTLRRNEKDFLLRKDLSYKKKFNNNLTSFNRELNALRDRGRITKSRHEALRNYLTAYQQAFHAVVEMEQQIGLTTGAGYMGELERIFIGAQPVITQLAHNTKQQIHKTSRGDLTKLFIIGATLFAFILMSIMRLAKSISKPVNNLKNYIIKLSKGEIPEKDILTSKRDEIAEITCHLYDLIDGLNEKIKFATRIENGDYDYPFKPASKHDMLGNTLLSMRNSLRDAEKDRKQHQQEIEIQNWTSTGIAKFSEILRKQHDTIDNFGTEIIVSLVDYLGANQGGFFVLNEEAEHYKLVGSYAFNRVKAKKKTIPLNEGLVGSCGFEKETIYLEELPDDYVEIKSGLGNASPRYLILVPLIYQKKLFGVLEIASFSQIETHHIEFVEKVGENIAASLLTTRINEQTQKLLKESTGQSERLAQQEEEMRQNMEELMATQEEMNRKDREQQAEIAALKERLAELEGKEVEEDEASN